MPGQSLPKRLQQNPIATGAFFQSLLESVLVPDEIVMRIRFPVASRAACSKMSQLV